MSKRRINYLIARIYYSVNILDVVKHIRSLDKILLSSQIIDSGGGNEDNSLIYSYAYNIVAELKATTEDLQQLESIKDYEQLDNVINTRLTDEAQSHIQKVIVRVSEGRYTGENLVQYLVRWVRTGGKYLYIGPIHLLTYNHKDKSKTVDKRIKRKFLEKVAEFVSENAEMFLTPEFFDSGYISQEALGEEDYEDDDEL